MQRTTTGAANKHQVAQPSLKKHQAPKTTGAPTAPAHPADATPKLGFDFVTFQAHLDAKHPKFTKKEWLLVPSSVAGGKPVFTRKRYGGYGQKFWAKNSSIVEWAGPAANALSMEFEGPKLAAARQAIAQGKTKDAAKFHEHVKVLAVAQKKLAAKSPVIRAEQQVEAAEAQLAQYRHEVQRRRDAEIQVAAQRLQDMANVRKRALNARRKPPASKEHEHDLAMAKATAGNLVLDLTVPARPDPRSSGAKKKHRQSGKPSESKRGLLTRAVAALLPRQAPSTKATEKATEKAAQRTQKRIAEFTQQAQKTQKTGVLMDREALRRVIESKASNSPNCDGKPQAYIESLLLDRSVSAYLPDEVFSALCELYAELGLEAGNRFTAEVNAELQRGAEEVARLQQVHQQALAAYNALPMPG